MHFFTIGLLVILVQFGTGSDDYEYLNRVQLQVQRLARSDNSNSRLDGLYSLQSASNNLVISF